MTRERKVARARELRASGLNNREIGERLGVTPSAVWKWLNPEAKRRIERKTEARPGRKAAKRKQEEGTCADCGGRTATAASIRCQPCENERKRREIRERAERCIALRREGLTNRAIDQHLGLPANTAAHIFCHDAPRFGLEVPPSPYWSRGAA